MEAMKEDDSLPQKLRDGLRLSIIQRKWISLQKNFKFAFYNSFDSSLFPFYDKMDELFTNYAAEHLNDTLSLGRFADKSINASQDEVTAFVMQLLDKTGSESDISLLRCEPSKEVRKPIKMSSSANQSEASKIIKELAKLPKESIRVQQTKMRIVPNTPFNRHCQLSTIVNQRKAAISSFKRSNDLQHEETRIRKRSSAPLRDVSVVQSTEDSFEYEVEALNECDLTEISYPDVKRVRMQNTTAETNMESYGSIESVTMVGVAGMDSDVIYNESSHDNEQTSILEVPSVNILSIENLSARPVSKIFPKKLIYDDENPEIDRRDEPPQWFQKFIMQYNKDMRKMNSRLEEIDVKLNKVLAQM